MYIEDWKLDPSGGYLATGFKRRWQPQPALFSDLQLIVAITTRDLYGPRGSATGVVAKEGGSKWGVGEKLTPLANTRTEFKRTQPAAKNDPTNRQVFRLMLFFPFIFIFGPQNVELNGFLLKSSCWMLGEGQGAGKPVAEAANGR